MKSGLLWYNLLTETLEEEGFILNPYDSCVANETIDDKQCTINWYVDNLKISHIQSKFVDNIINMIE